MVSVSVFQAPHSPHWPAHLGKVEPHSVQPYMRLALAIGTPGKKRDDSSAEARECGRILRNPFDDYKYPHKNQVY
jgi:hypothetical protein